LTSENRIEANRLNALKSTGPRTPEGKAASSQNAITHGLTAKKHLVIPGEDPDDYDRERQHFLEHCDAADPFQAALAERACNANWKLRRIERGQNARTAERTRHAAANFDLQQLQRAEKLGDALFYDPVNRCENIVYTPEMLRKLEVWNALDPAIIAAELETFAHGVDWMIARWVELAAILDDEGFWHFDSRFYANKLMGRRPEDIMYDPVVRDVFLACNALHPEPWKLWLDVQQATNGSESRHPVYQWRTQTWEMKRIPTKEAALKMLKSLVANELARLRALKAEVLDPQAEADRAEAPLRAILEVDAETLASQRYEVQLDRSLRGAVLELTKLRKATAAAAEAEEKAATERARRERKTGSGGRNPIVSGTTFSRNEASAKKARERRTSGDTQKPFVETLRVRTPPGRAGASSRKRV
jgi:hypothetical protein